MLARAWRSGVRPSVVRRSLLSVRGVQTLTIDDTGGLFPRDNSEGLDYGLNWSLVRQGVTPLGKAFRNLPTDMLIEHSPNKTDDNKALVVDSFEAPFDLFTLGEAGMSRRHFRRALKQATSHLSSNPGVFVADGSAGAKVRAICDTPEMALFFRHLLRGHKGDTSGFDADVVVYHVLKLKLDQDDQLKLGIPSSNFLFLNPGEKSIVAIGDVPTSLVHSSLTQLIGADQVQWAGELEEVGQKDLRTREGDLVEKLEAGQESLYRHTRPLANA